MPIDMATLGIGIQGPDVGPAVQQLDKLLVKGETVAGNIQRGFAFLAGYLSGRTFLAAFQNVANLARESEMAQTRLEGVIRATGNTAGITAEQMDQLATSMSRGTLFDDEAIKNAAAQLATFRNIAGPTFTETIRLGGDLAAVMGTDLASAVNTLGRALADPERGMLQLRRAGIVLNDEEKALVTNALAANDILGAQSAVLEAVQNRVGGTAAGSNQGLTGALHALNLEWENYIQNSAQAENDTVLGAIMDAIQNNIVLATNALRGFNDEMDRAARGQRIALGNQLATMEARGPSSGHYEGNRFISGETEIARMRKAYQDMLHYEHALNAIRGRNAQAAQAAAGAGGVPRDLDAEARARAALIDTIKEGLKYEKDAKEVTDRHRAAMDDFNHTLQVRAQLLEAETVAWRKSGTEAANALQLKIDKTHQYEKALALAADAAGQLKDREGIGPQGGGSDKSGDIFGNLGGLTSGSASGILGALALIGGASTGVGAVVGVMGGFIDSIFGTGEAAEKARQALVALQQGYLSSFAASAAQLGFRTVQTQGNNQFRAEAISPLEQQRAQELARYNQQLEDSLKSFNVNSQAWAREYARINALHDAVLARIIAEEARRQKEFQEDYRIREMRALGFTKEADAMAFAIAQQREMANAIRDGADAATQAALASALKAEATRRETDIIQRSIDELTQTIGGLQTFKDALSLNRQLSILSPIEQMREARRQYEQVITAARGGDQAAAGRLPAVAQAFLEASRGVNASGMAYVNDFNRVRSETDAIIKMYEAQRTDAQYQLDELKKLSGIGIGIKDAVIESISVLQAGFVGVIQKQEETNLALADRIDNLTRMILSANPS